MRSRRCCNTGMAFGTVSVLVHLGEIHVKLHGEPCCEKEFASFIDILTTMRQRLAADVPFYILYNLTQCPFNRSYMTAQERVLAGASACVVIVRNAMLRRAVVLATILQKKTKMKICESQSEGLRWLKTIQLQGI